MESETIAVIRRVIKEELGKILMATITENQDQLRVTAQRFATDSPITNMRWFQPFGLSSRAPVGTQILTAPIDNNPSHINAIGDFDEGKPSTAEGETVLYDANGHVIYLSQSKMTFGSKTSANPMVLGDILQTFEDTVWNAIVNGAQLGWAAGGIPVFLDPGLRAQIQQALSTYVDTASSNFLSQKAFTERGP